MLYREELVNRRVKAVDVPDINQISINTSFGVTDRINLIR